MSDPLDLATLGGETASEPAATAAAPALPTLAPFNPQEVGPLGLDPRIVWGVGGEAAGDLPGRLAVASVGRNRADATKLPPGDIFAQPGEFAGIVNGQKNFPVGSPQYNALEAQIAPIITGEQKPTVPYTGFRTHGYPTDWANGAKIETVGGNDFAIMPPSPKWGGAPPDIDLAKVGGETTPSSAQAAVLGAPHGAPGASGQAADIKITPNAKGVYTDASGTAYTPAADAGNGFFRDPQSRLFQIDTGQPAVSGATALGLKPAGTVTPPAMPAGQSWIDRAYIGADQGLRNIGTTADKFQAWVGQNVPAADWADRNISPLLGAKYAPNAVAQDVAFRDRNDLMYGASPAYNVGKFGGSLAGTLPLMAMTGGAAGAGMGALTDAAPSVAPAVDFLAGRFGGNALMRGGSLATNGALQGGEAAAINSGGSEQPLGSQVLGGMETGGVLGAGVPAVAGVANRLMSPAAHAVAPYVADLVNTADGLGIKLRPTQIAAADERLSGVPDGPLSARDNQLMNTRGSGYAANQTTQNAAWNARAAQNIGAPAGSTNFSPPVMSAAKAANSAAFERAAQSATITDTDGLQSALSKVVHDASLVVPDSELTPLLKQVQNIASTIGEDRTLSGQSYLALTKTGSPLDRLASGDGNTAWYAQKLKETLDDFAQENMTPAQRADFAQARANWRNMKLVEPLVAKSGGKGDYQLNPADLLQRMATNPYTRDSLIYSGGDELGDLARVGTVFSAKTSSQGTRPGLFDMAGHVAEKALPYLGTADLAYGMFGHPAEAAGLAALGAGGAGALAAARYGLNAVRGARGMSPAYRNALMGNAPVAATPQATGPIADFVRRNYIPSAVVGQNLLMSPAPSAP